MVPDRQQPSLSIASKGPGYRLILKSGTWARAAGCATDSKISNQRSPSLRGAATRTLELERGHDLINWQQVPAILAGCPGSGPTGFGGHLGTLAMTEGPPA